MLSIGSIVSKFYGEKKIAWNGCLGVFFLLFFFWQDSLSYALLCTWAHKLDMELMLFSIQGMFRRLPYHASTPAPKLSPQVYRHEWNLNICFYEIKMIKPVVFSLQVVDYVE